MKATKILVVAGSLMMAGQVISAPLKTATVTAVVKEVKISENSAEAQVATEGQKFGASSTMFTGRGSRAELTFPDNTISRIGANSVFRIGSGNRDMSIDKGSFLLQVPKNAGGATIRTTTVTAAITGTTTMIEYNPGQWIKFITLEGEAVLTNTSGDKVKIPAGQMLVMHPNAKKFPALVFIDVKKLTQTSKLMDVKVFGELEPGALQEILNTVNQQMALRRTGDLLPNGPIKYGPVPSEDSPNNQEQNVIVTEINIIQDSHYSPDDFTSPDTFNR
jgi:hypothetical protein